MSINRLQDFMLSDTIIAVEGLLNASASVAVLHCDLTALHCGLMTALTGDFLIISSKELLRPISQSSLIYRYIVYCKVILLLFLILLL